MRFWLTSLAILAELLVITTAASYEGHADLPKSIQDAANEAGNDVCETQECYDTASRIKAAMDFDIDPCDNFYEYTCGGFMKNTPLSLINHTNIFYTGRQKFHLKLKSLFEMDAEIDDIKPFRQAKTLYASCMNEKAIEAKGILPLKQFTRKLGGWPVAEGASWNELSFNWEKLMAEKHRFGLPSTFFIDITMEVDKQHNSQRVISLDAPYIIPSYLFSKGLNRTDAKEYYQIMVDIAVNLGADRKMAETELMEAILFQNELNKVRATFKPEEKRRMTLERLIQRYPKADWRYMFGTMYKPMQTIAYSDVIVVKKPQYIKKVINLLSTKPKRVQANLAMFQIIEGLLKYVNQATYQNWKDFMFKTYGIWEDYEKSEQCIDMMIKDLPSIVAAMYMKKFFNSEKKAYVEDILREMKHEFQGKLDKVRFLDDATRIFAKEKESENKHLIGYPEGGHLENDYLNEYYRDLEFSDNEYFNNYLRLKQFNFKKDISELPDGLNKIYRERIAKRLNMFFPNNDYNSNTIEVSAHVLDGDLLNLGLPDYVNFAYIGSAIAFEMIRVIADPGNGYDANGVKKDWWTADSKKPYAELGKCFVDQYANYVADKANHTVYGENTLSRNIADNGGMNMAYHAYLNSMLGKTPDKQLPGLDLSPKQMYWITLANMYCEKTDADVRDKWEEYHESPPLPFRLAGSLSNSKEFANDFNCRSGSKMNPIEKCSAW